MVKREYAASQDLSVLNALQGIECIEMASPSTPGRVTEETMTRLREDVTRLTRALNVPEGANAIQPARSVGADSKEWQSAHIALAISCESD